MYVSHLHLQDFRAFGQTEVTFHHPSPGQPEEVGNVSVLLGDNGGGKSSVLRAIALGCLSPILPESGFVPYRLVRRPDGKEATIRLNLLLEPEEAENGLREVTMETLIRRRGSGDTDSITGAAMQSDLLYAEDTAALFLCAYGATRRIDVGDYSESSARRSRGGRYQRVASLFEDQVALVPFTQRLFKTGVEVRTDEMVGLLNEVLPSEVRCLGLDKSTRELTFEVEKVETPMPSLSDGYRAFIAFVSDLVGRLAESAGDVARLADMPGVVLVDEIDLHLHPSWQRIVVPTLARAFPRLQFIFTSHSALVAGSVRSRNVFVVDRNEHGLSQIGQLGERTLGRSAEELLLSGYFGLQTTRAVPFQEQAQALFKRAADGDGQAALEYLRSLSGAANIP